MSSKSNPQFESLEPRMLLDSQIGTVTMPSTGGYLSAGIYDTNDQLLYTVYAREPEPANAVVPICWNGVDNVGTIHATGTYKWKAIVSNVEVTDQGNVSDSSFAPTNNAVDNWFTTGVAANSFGTPMGYVGGTITKHAGETSYGDTNLNNNNTTLTLANNDISASGDFYVSNSINSGVQIYGTATSDGVTSFIGHYSKEATANKRDFLGLEIMPGSTDRYRFNIRSVAWDPTDGYLGNSNKYSTQFEIMGGSGLYHFSYSYSHTTHLFTARIWNDAGTVDHTFETLDMSTGVLMGHNPQYNAFGIGTEKEMSSGNDDPAMKTNLVLDNVTYTGGPGLVDFNTPLTGPDAWVGTNNTDNLAQQYSAHDGSFYTVAWIEENIEMQKYGADGTFIWGDKAAPNFAAAVDGLYEYVTRIDSAGTGLWNNRVYRYFAQDGAAAPFPGGLPYLTINSNVADPGDSGMQGDHYTATEWRTLGNWGLAVDNSYIWVSDSRNNRVAIYNKTTGAFIKDVAITQPIGLAVDPLNAGTAWVANSGNSVTKLTYTGSGNITPSTSITGLSDPSGVAIGGPNNYLYVADTNNGHILEYNISSTPSLTRTLGSKDTGGAAADDKFLWTEHGHVASLAIDGNGVLAVVDDRRVQRFNTASGAWSLATSTIGEANISPQELTTSGTGRETFFNNGYMYEVEPEYTGGPRAGWLGNGTFRLVQRYHSDGTTAAFVYTNVNSSGHNLLYSVEGQSVIIYNVDSAQRLSAIVGVGWMGTDLRFNPSGGRYTWIDSDNDGQVDWNGIGSGSDGEVTWNIARGQNAQIGNSPWVDGAGNIYYVDNSSNLIKLWITGWDSHNNPIYSWSNQTTVIASQQSDPYGFSPVNVRIDKNGDIWAQGNCSRVNAVVPPLLGNWPAVNTGGMWVAKYNSAGVRQFIAPSLDRYQASMAIDTGTATSTQYYFTGGQIFANMFTSDGLLVGQFTPGYASGYSGGWMDHAYSIGAYSPGANQMYIYAADVLYGKAIRYRVDNLSSITQYGYVTPNNFSFTVPNDVVAHWELNNSMLETVSGSTAGSYWQNGNPPVLVAASYAAGHSGNALSFDGNGHWATIPFSTQFTDQTISLWIKPSTLVNDTYVLGRYNGGSLYEDLRIIYTGGHYAFQYDVADSGITWKSALSNVALTAGQWYHVAVTVNSGGVANIYVNGTVGTPSASVAGLPHNLNTLQLGAGPSGICLNGAIDDVRFFSRVLNSTDLGKLTGDTLPYTVSVVATDATGAEQNQDKGVFTIKRDGSSGPLTVNYTMSSGNGTDFTVVGTSVVIADGQLSNTVVLTPIDDASADGGTNGYTNATLTVSSNAAYTVGSSNAAVVRIFDNESSLVTPNSQWSFDNNTYDLLGHHAANPWAGVTAWATFSPAGKVGATLFTDNFNETYQAPYYVDINYPNQTSYTAAGWVQITQETIDSAKNAKYYNSDLTVFARYDGTSTTTYSEAIKLVADGSGPSNGVFFAHYTNDGTYKAVTDTTAVSPGWYFVAITAANSGTAQLYVGADGTAPTSRGTPVSVGTLWTGGDRFEIGRQVGAINTTPGFWGGLDELKVYDAPLTLTQIQALASACIVTIAKNVDAAEPSTNGSFIVSRTGSTTNALTVYYSVDGTGTATPGSDYSALGTSVVIPPSMASTTITVTTIDDSSQEATETVKVNLATGSGYLVGSSASATVNITDNDTPTVTVSATDASAAESPLDTGTFVVTRTGSTSSELTVNFSIGGAATSGSDYTALGTSVIIPIGSSSAAITLTPINDTNVEATEDALLTLAAGSYNIGTPGNATINITSEDSSSNSCTYVLTDTTHVGNWKGVYGVDGYNIPGDSVSYPSGVTVTTTATNYVLADPSTDGRALQQVSGSTRVAAWMQANSMNWTMTVNFGATTRQFAMYVWDAPGLGRSMTVDAKDGATILNTQSLTGTTEVGGVYLVYQATGTITFSFTSTSSWYPLVSGLFFDGGGAPQPTVSIAPSVNATEPSTNGTFIVSRTGSTTNPLTVNYAVDASSTATSGTDYTALGTSVVIPAGQSSTAISLLVKDDSTSEATETVMVDLASGSYTIGTANATLSILDNDADLVSVSASDANAAESPLDTGTFIISRLGSLSSAVTLTYAMSGSATSGQDYSALGTVIIPANQASVAVTLTPVDDGDYEATETATLTVQNGTGYTAGASPTASINITSEDALPVISITPGVNATEPSNDGTFIVSRTGGTTNPLTVNYTVDGSSTATSGTDYTALGTSVVIPPGQTSTSITLLVKDDSTSEPSETVIVNLASGSYTNGTASATINILDNDADLVSVSASDASAAESPLDTGTFIISRLGSLSSAVTLTYAMSGLATSGQDYTALGTIVIPANQASVAVTLTPINDPDYEATETATLTVQTGTGYTPGASPSASINITSEDGSTVTPSGKWLFEGNLNDSAGSNNGTFVQGSAVYDPAGRCGNAIDLSGSSNYFQIMDTVDPTAYTISAWVKADTVAASNIITRSSGDVNNASHQIRINASGKFEHSTYDGGIKTVTGTTTVVAGTWYHVAITASNSGMVRLYVNGQEEGTAVSVGTLWTAGDRWLVGSNNPMYSLGFFDGKIDDLRVYQQVLSASQIRDMADIPPCGQWKLDGGLTDSAGLIGAATIVNGPAIYATGRTGSAIDLNGTTQYLNIADATNPTAYTIAAWVKPDTVTGAVNIVTRSSGDINNSSHQIRINASGKFEHSTYDGSIRTVTGTTTVVANTWYFVAITASNNGMVRLYVNGQEEGTAVSVGTLWAGGNCWLVGSNNPMYGLGFFDGKIDDLRVYRQVLSQAEIARIGGFAQDGFESGNGSGGTGWGGNWSTSGTVAFTNSGTPKNGTYHMQLSGNNATATRAVNLSGLTSAHLMFDWKANSFEASETAKVEIYDGTTWITVKTIVDGSDDNAYHHEDIDLSSYSLTSSFQVRFSLLNSDSTDYFYVDNLFITK